MIASNTPTWTARDVPDQSGRVVIITGASGGLGLEAAKMLAGRGAVTILACRSQVKGDAARELIRGQHPGAELHTAVIDTAELASVRAFAERVLAQWSRVDVLINNAGVMAIPRELTKDGFERQLATNHLGHFALTGLLLPALLRAPRARIVAVSSLAARSGAIHFGDLMGERGYKPWGAYNQSKLADLIFGIELQRRLARAGATATAVIAHPGASTTNLFATPGAKLTKQILMPLMHFMFQPAAQGALPILYAATAEGALPGGYYGPDGFNEMKGSPAPALVPPSAKDEDVALKLWDVSETLTGVRYLSQGTAPTL